MYDERMNLKWIEATWQTLDSLLAQGFNKIEDLDSFQSLKRLYEEETYDFEFSEREVVAELEGLLQLADGEDSRFDRSNFENLLVKLGELNPSMLEYYSTLRYELVK